MRTGVAAAVVMWRRAILPLDRRFSSVEGRLDAALLEARSAGRQPGV
jgi:hypothetical protein